MKTRIWIFLLLFLAPLAADRGQWWVVARIPMGEINGLHFLFWQQHRFDLHTAKLVDDRYSLWMRKPLLPWLEGEVHYTLINTRRFDQTRYDQSGRVELELNPRFPLNKDLTLRLRNRYEIMHRDNDPQVTQTFRQRHQLFYELNLKYVKWVSIHNEFFFNLTDQQMDQVRFIPLEVGFPFFKTHVVTAGVMARYLKREGIWHSQFVVATGLDW